MPAKIRRADLCESIEVRGQTILEAIQALRIDFPAPCGGNGTCGKCQVLIHDHLGTRHALACQTALDDDMEIYLESRGSMTIQESGAARHLTGREDKQGFGLAIDIGTTTVVCRIHDLNSGTALATMGRVNPQVIYGADVIARISASAEGNLEVMCELIRDAIDGMADELCDIAGIERSLLVDAVVVGNTVMEHIAARLDPESIGVSPFRPLSPMGGMFPFAPVIDSAYFAPVVSGYVGGDIVAGLMAARLQDSEDVRIYLDLGTNGEVALGSRKNIVSCATAAGPVFEGAGIRFGMPAQPGAISSVRHEAGTLHLETIGSGDALGICGTGLIEAVATLLEIGVIDETGRLLGADEVEATWAGRIVESDEDRAFVLDEGRSIYLMQKDVRNVQLAKAAICAGILTLLEERGIMLDDVGGILIAGGFGSHLDSRAAARIGLFPSELVDRAASIGNMAIEGASQILLSGTARNEASRIAATSDYIELSTSAKFNAHYMECMYF